MSIPRASCFWAGEDNETIEFAIKKEHNGHYRAPDLTPDFCMNKLFKAAISANSHKIIGNALHELARSIVKQYTVVSSDEMDPSVWYSEESDAKPYQYFISKGFKIERVPVYNPDINIISLKFVKNHKRNQLLEEYKNIYAWKLTI